MKTENATLKRVIELESALHIIMDLSEDAGEVRRIAQGVLPPVDGSMKHARSGGRK